MLSKVLKAIAELPVKAGLRMLPICSFLIWKKKKKFKLGVDYDGVITEKPELFAFLTKATIRNGGEVHIITGRRITPKFLKKLKEYGISYTHTFSIIDYHKAIGSEFRVEPHKQYKIELLKDDRLYDSTKGEYCRKNGISLHIDDSQCFIEYFSTPFALFVSKKPK